MIGVEAHLGDRNSNLDCTTKEFASELFHSFDPRIVEAIAMEFAGHREVQDKFVKLERLQRLDACAERASRNLGLQLMLDVGYNVGEGLTVVVECECHAILGWVG